MWSLSKLVEVLRGNGIADISRETRRVILKAGGVSWQSTKTWKSSNDPEFVAKMSRVLDFYDDPPDDGRVICVDEFGPLNLLPRAGRGRFASGRPKRGWLNETQEYLGGDNRPGNEEASNPCGMALRWPMRRASVVGVGGRGSTAGHCAGPGHRTCAEHPGCGGRSPAGWAVANGHRALPASAHVLLAYFAAYPRTLTTQRGRATAVGAAHRVARRESGDPQPVPSTKSVVGLPSPAEAESVRRVLRPAVARADALTARRDAVILHLTAAGLSWDTIAG